MRWTDLPARHNAGFVSRLVNFAVLVVPAVVLGLLAYRANSLPLALGAGVQLLFALVFARAPQVWQPPVSACVVVLYLVALGWLWIATQGADDGPTHLGLGLLLLGAVGLFALHDLNRTGAEPLRRANKWCRRITGRVNWPLQLADCRTLPEAHTLRDSIRDEAGPALALLSDPRPAVQVAALGALEYRPRWRAGEAELVLRAGQDSPEPAVRVAAAFALAGVNTPDLITGLAGLLRDPAPEVRKAAAEALLWDGDRRWASAREAVHLALADPKLADDGPLFTGATRLPAAALADLTTWAGEHPPLAGRAIQTLVDQYHHDLIDAERPELASELAAQMLDTNTSPALRVELAALLRDHHLLTPDLLDRLTNLDQPGPIRLFAAEVMLQVNPNDPDGIDVLRGLARQPNRELAVQIAGILQNVLGLELGLPPGELPAHTTKTAADVARRVLAWANGATPEMIRPTSGPMPGSRAVIPGLQATNIFPTPEPVRKPRGSSAVF